MPHIVAIIGSSGSGKTTFIEKLIPELKSRGYRVATVKHTPHGMELDRADKDSMRHLRAGSEATITSSPHRLALVKSVKSEVTLSQIARLVGKDYDLILAEGYKQGNIPKIEVHRKEAGLPLVDIKRLVAMVTDEPLKTRARQFSLDDVKGVADLIEQNFIQPRKS